MSMTMELKLMFSLEAAVTLARHEPPTRAVSEGSLSEGAEPSPIRKRGSNLDGELMTARPSSMVSTNSRRRGEC